MPKKYQEKNLYTTNEKLEEWGYGEWVEEPDDVEFEYLDYICSIFRNSAGVLCGYVTLPEGHPWIGKEYMDIDVEVHGGLSFGCLMIRGWVIGFDCAHGTDLVPSIGKMTKIYGIDPQRRPANNHSITYKNVKFVIEQCKSIVDQAIGVKHD